MALPWTTLVAGTLAALWPEIQERLGIGAFGTDSLSDLLFGYFGERLAHNG